MRNIFLNKLTAGVAVSAAITLALGLLWMNSAQPPVAEAQTVRTMPHPSCLNLASGSNEDIHNCLNAHVGSIQILDGVVGENNEVDPKPRARVELSIPYAQLWEIWGGAEFDIGYAFSFEDRNGNNYGTFDDDRWRGRLETFCVDHASDTCKELKTLSASANFEGSGESGTVSFTLFRGANPRATLITKVDFKTASYTPMVPGPVRNLRVTDVDGTVENGMRSVDLTLRWDSGARSERVSDYRVRYRSSGDWTEVDDELAATERSIRIEDLAYSTHYQFEVRPNSNYGSSHSESEIYRTPYVALPTPVPTPFTAPGTTGPITPPTIAPTPVPYDSGPVTTDCNEWTIAAYNNGRWHGHSRLVDQMGPHAHKKSGEASQQSWQTNADGWVCGQHRHRN